MKYDDIYAHESLYKTMRAYRGKREARAAVAVCMMLVFIGFVLGVVLYRICGDSIDIDADSVITSYFKGMFAEAGSANDKLGVILYSFYHEMAFPLLVFVMGYTVFSPIFSASICVWQAAICSFAICMLEFTTHTGIFVESLIYLISRIAIISVDVALAIRAYFNSVEFMKKEACILDIFKQSKSRAYIFDFIISAGVMFITVTLTLVLMNFM